MNLTVFTFMYWFGVAVFVKGWFVHWPEDQVAVKEWLLEQWYR